MFKMFKRVRAGAGQGWVPNNRLVATSQHRGAGKARRASSYFARGSRFVECGVASSASAFLAI